MRKCIKSIDDLDETDDLVRSMYAYWAESRHGKSMPCRSDLDPIDLPQHLPGIMLIDVEGVDDSGRSVYRYRVVGQWEIRARGHNPTGKTIEEGCY